MTLPFDAGRIIVSVFWLSGVVSTKRANATQRKGHGLMAKFKINHDVPGVGFYPDVEAAFFRKVEGYFYFMDDSEDIVDCISEAFVRRIHRDES